MSDNRLWESFDWSIEPSDWGNDTTENHDRLSDLLIHEQLTQFSVEYSPAPIFWVDRHGGVTYANGATCKLLQYNRTDLLNLNVHDLDVYLSEHPWSVCWRFLKRYKKSIFKTYYRTRTGDYLATQLYARYVLIGRHDYACVFVQNICTEQPVSVEQNHLNQVLQETETTLIRTEKLYQELTDTIDDVVFTADFNLICTFWNRATEQLTGIPAKQAVGRSLYDLFPNLLDSGIVQLYWKVMRFRHMSSCECEWKTDKQTLHLEIKAYPSQYGILVLMKDRTDYYVAEEELRRQVWRERLLGAIAQNIRQSLNLPDILKTTVTEVRQLLQVDRVIIYQFEPNKAAMTGTVIEESIAAQIPSMLGWIIRDPWITNLHYQHLYRQNRVLAVEDIYALPLSAEHLVSLEFFQIRAVMIVPLFQCEQLWGVLIAHHCASARRWLPWEVRLLQNLATQCGIAIQQAQLYQRLEQANQELQRLATLDGLTHIANRRHFDDYLAQEWQRGIRDQSPLALIMADVDFFKAYNDHYGHQAGDDCLRRVAAVLQHTVHRPADLVARYGGEEFALILPNTDLAGARKVAEQVLLDVSSKHIPYPDSPISDQLTLSLGVVSLVPTTDLVTATLIAIADAALYKAKQDGRDRYCLYTELLDPFNLSNLADNTAADNQSSA